MDKEERRRRKIIARGNDRMALITGRIHTLDPDPFLKSSSFSTRRRDNLAAQHARSSSEPVATNEEVLFQEDHSHGGEDLTETVPRTHNSEKISKGDDSRSRVPHLHKHDAKKAAPLRVHANSPKNSLSHCLSSITPNEINFSIMSSEDTRAICAVVLAILVVLSHVTHPHHVVSPKSLIAYKPLFVVILTDVFIVAVRLTPFTQIRRVDKKQIVEEDGDNWGGAFKLLELGVVLHQTIRALFIDCSFYLVIVVCGLSMV